MEEFKGFKLKLTSQCQSIEKERFCVFEDAFFDLVDLYGVPGAIVKVLDYFEDYYGDFVKPRE